MTDDFKEKLLDYVTGDLEIEQGTDEPILTEDNGIIKSSHSSFIRGMIRKSGYYEGGGDVIPATFNQLGRLQFTNTDKTIIYGNMVAISPYSKDPQGALIIADENNNYIAYITEFSTGTIFNKFETLNVDETNLIYGVDYVISSSQHRFILLNDIISSYLTYNDYKCILRKSYIFNYNYSMQLYKTYKEYGSANYLFVGEKYISENIYNPLVITVDVNVGEQNEWHDYTTNDQIFINYIIGSYCIWQNNSLQLKFGCCDRYNQYYFEFSFDGSTLSRTKNITCAGINSIEMTSINDTYIIASSFSGSPLSWVIKFYKINGSSLDTIYTETISNTSNYGTINTYSINGLLFGLVSHVVQDEYFDRIYLIVGTDIYYIDISNVLQITELFVSNYFNLYKIYYQGYDPNEVVFTPTTRTGTSSLDYNSNNYNGESYSNYNSLIAHKGTLYNNGNLIFSRNLYNKTILNNTTTSTLQIPSSMLNDTNIEQENLVSETNSIMVNNQSTITKNIYEMLLINFINTINVLDEDTSINYPSAANYVNTNINTGTQSNYENTQCSKYRINYADNTTSIGSLTWTSIDKFNKETTISISVSKLIMSIDLISENETTTYMSIDGSDLIVGNDYTINQKIRTSYKPLPVQLQYNNEDVMYNNENVMVYVKE